MAGRPEKYDWSAIAAGDTVEVKLTGTKKDQFTIQYIRNRAISKGFRVSGKVDGDVFRFWRRGD